MSGMERAPLPFVSECRSARRGAEPRVYSHLLASGFLIQFYFMEGNGGPF